MSLGAVEHGGCDCSVGRPFACCDHDVVGGWGTSLKVSVCALSGVFTLVRVINSTEPPKWVALRSERRHLGTFARFSNPNVRGAQFAGMQLRGTGPGTGTGTCSVASSPPRGAPGRQLIHTLDHLRSRPPSTSASLTSCIPSSRIRTCGPRLPTSANF